MNFNTLEADLYKKLTALAFERSTPFCYCCYKPAPTGTCKSCHSDDLMREREGSGVEYGTDWIVEAILKEELEPIDEAEFFESFLDGCYPETTEIGFITYDTISAMKELDPICFEIAQNEHINFERDEGRLVSFDNGSTHYDVEEVEKLVRFVEVPEEAIA